jgi:hypothetical protein
MSDVPYPKIGHLLVSRVIYPPHFRNYFLNKLKHPLDESVGLIVGILREPNVLLFVARHHEHYFFLHNFPHSSLELD